MSVFLQRVWIQITSDRKRFAVLCAVAALGLLLWSRVILVSNLPRTAVADPVEDPAEDPKAGNVTPATDNPRPTRHISLDLLPRRDPFAVDTSAFPAPSTSAQITEDQGKSLARQAEDSEAAALQFLSVLKTQAARYRLEGVMPADLLVVINGKVYGIGQPIELPDSDAKVRHPQDDKSGSQNRNQPTFVFRLFDVWPRSAIIEAYDQCFELTLDSPQSGKN